MIEWPFVGNLRVLRAPSRTLLESFPIPWSPFLDQSFLSLVSFVDPPSRPLAHPSQAFSNALVCLRRPSCAFVDHSFFLLFQASPAPA